jgi:coproporphyrinogen III oxidase-like Fe-S oxidoreductase
MILTGHPALKFDSFFPLYNWIYPLSGSSSARFVGASAASALSEIAPSGSRALYVHIPFCETICTFCPFVRTATQEDGLVQAYVDALVQEIESKADIGRVAAAPIGAVFFGGGTPSYLSPQQILQVGNALRRCFDLSHCREFSFELEVKSASWDRLEALKQIGVTHARFGAQTFSTRYRSLFNLTATVDQVHLAAERLLATFPHVSCDILYGMHGESADEFFDDIAHACSLGLSNIDFYPINNAVTQPSLTRGYNARALKPTSGLNKFYMGTILRSAMYERGFLPHNGHGYVKCDQEELIQDPVTTESYSFVYHEHTLGYRDHDLLGFGVNAISSFAGGVAINNASMAEYIKSIKHGDLSMTVLEHSPATDAARPLCLQLPYHGSVDKSDIRWHELEPQQFDSLARLIANDLVVDSGDVYRLTRTGFHWYSNVMFYLLPLAEQRALRRILARALRDPKKSIETIGIDPTLLKVD